MKETLLMTAAIATLAAMPLAAQQTATPGLGNRPGAGYPSYNPGPAVKNGYTADNIRNAAVYDKNGKKIGEVQDIIIGPSGQLRRLIVGVNQGLFGTGGRSLAVNWNELTPHRDQNGDTDYFTAPVTKQNVQQYGVFKNKEAAQNGKREWRASELIGDYINLKDLANYGVVTDLVFDKQGQLRMVAASPDVTNSLLEFYTPYMSNGWEPGEDYYVVPYTRSEIANLLPGKAGSRVSSSGSSNSSG